MNALGYLAEWFADEMVANETKIHGFDPSQEFVNIVTHRMVTEPTLGWLDRQSARMDLADLWPNCKALDDVGRTVTPRKGA
jgi:hypothetical protein